MLRFFADERASALAQDLLCSFGASRRVRPFTFLHDRLTPYRAAAHTQMEPDQRSRTRSEPGTNIHEKIAIGVRFCARVTLVRFGGRERRLPFELNETTLYSPAR